MAEAGAAFDVVLAAPAMRHGTCAAPLCDVAAIAQAAAHPLCVCSAPVIDVSAPLVTADDRVHRTAARDNMDGIVRLHGAAPT